MGNTTRKTSSTLLRKSSFLSWRIFLISSHSLRGFFLLRQLFFFFHSRNAYPTKAPNTKKIQTNIQAAIAVIPSTLGELAVIILLLWRNIINNLRRYILENISEDQEECYQHGHPSRDNIGRYQEADPGDDHKQSRWKIVDDQILQNVSLKLHLNSWSQRSSLNYSSLTIWKTCYTIVLACILHNSVLCPYSSSLYSIF